MIENQETLTTKVKRLARAITDPMAKILDKWGVSPNLITWIGFSGSIVAAYFVANHKFVAAAITLLIFASMDALDGALARYKNETSVFGAFLDSVLDRYAELILFAGFLYYFVQTDSQLGIFFSYFSISFALIVSYTRARASDVGVDIEEGVFTRMERYFVIVIFLFLKQPLACVIIVASLSAITAIQRFWIGRNNLKK